MAGHEKLIPQLPAPIGSEEQKTRNRARLIKHFILFGRGIRDALDEKGKLNGKLSEIAQKAFPHVLFQLENLGIKPKVALRMISPLSQFDMPKPIKDAEREANIEGKISKGLRIIAILKKAGPFKQVIAIPVKDSKGKLSSVEISKKTFARILSSLITDLIEEGFSRDEARKSLGITTPKQPISL